MAVFAAVCGLIGVFKVPSAYARVESLEHHAEHGVLGFAVVLGVHLAEVE